MFQNQVRIIFPPLPFDVDIPYYEIKPASKIDFIEESIQSDSTEEKLMNEDVSNARNFYLNRKRKCHVRMNEKASIFKFSFYQIFTTRKKFPKKYVIMIHNQICINLNLRSINRDETRSIDLYFSNFAKHSEKILLYIKNNKNNIIQMIPELKAIMNLYIE
ncbi:hypothetical protein M9Y10_007168 [Tritrichomonas musculus]|uniref:Uncharacterized protein n=1 Tax=Tritrichomonas musculus TaxID=1915356 RepID=A0ABR2J1J8_9EUKA